MPLLETKGAGSAQGFGLSLGGEEAVYVEDVFSTYLIKPAADFTTYSINNGIDLLGEGGMTWFKARDAASQNNLVYDTVRGSSSGNANALITNGTQAQQTTFFDFVTPNANGFTVNFASGGGQLTNSGINYASWTFREQAKFFDVVTYTGNGLTTQVVNHNLGSAPGMIIAKRTDSAGGWAVWHRGNGTTSYGLFALNSTSAATANFNPGSNPLPSATEFYPYLVWDTGNPANSNGGTYVAYLFAHDAGGFGDDGTENVISCGSFTSTTSAQEINLGYEPQWLLWKFADRASDWYLTDSMRGFQVDRSGSTVVLNPNSSAVEQAWGTVGPTSRGFTHTNGTAGIAIIYIAIRRGPMKVPTSGTSVLGLSARSGTGANATVSGGQIADAALIKNRGSAVGDLFAARLTGTGYLETSSTAAEVAAGTTILQANPWDVMDGVKVGTTSTITNASSNTFINYLFRRAPGFFDVVCYTGTGSVRTVSHNLGAVPELMIVKKRSAADAWVVYANNDNTDYLVLNTTAATVDDNTIWNDTSPTSSVFTVGTNDDVNGNTATFVAYLFATVAGVSKVFSFTGNGSSQTINCGFTGGARFVMIKRTDSTGSWYCWDSARGIVASNDPHLSLNTTAAEVTTDDSVDADSTGFVVNQNSATNVNVNGATYIGLAVA